LQQFASNPKVSVQVFDVIAELQGHGLAGQRRRTSCARSSKTDASRALPEIAAQFRALKNAQSGSSDAWCTALSRSTRRVGRCLSGVLEKRFGRKLNFPLSWMPS
jgi:F-type H+-transporting ATPase subunit delta